MTSRPAPTEAATTRFTPTLTIAEELDLHHGTLRRAIEGKRFVGTSLTRVTTSALDPYTPFIAVVLAQHPRLRSSRIFDMLRDRGEPARSVVVRSSVRTMGPLPCEAG